MQIIRNRLSSLEALPSGTREELTDISHCLADVVISVLNQQHSSPDELRIDIQKQIKTAIELDERLYMVFDHITPLSDIFSATRNFRKESKNEYQTMMDRESIISIPGSVYSLGSFAHYFEDTSANQNLALSLQDLINGPLTTPGYQYPVGPGTESQYSFHSHPSLPLTTSPDTNVEHLDFRDSLSSTEKISKADDLINRLETVRGLGKQQEALDAVQTAVSLYRELELDQPGKFNADLAKSLFKLDRCFNALNRQKEALLMIQEAVMRYRQPAAEDPEFNRYLAKSLKNLSLRLSAAEQPEAALKAIRESVALRREIARDQSVNSNSRLANSLSELSHCLRDLGRHDEALFAVQEAVSRRLDLAKDLPAIYNPDLARSLFDLDLCLAILDRQKEALVVVQEVVFLYRQLAGDRPQQFNPELAQSLGNLSIRLSDLGQPEAALTAARESIALVRFLARNRPEKFQQALDKSLKRLQQCLSDLGQSETT